MLPSTVWTGHQIRTDKVLLPAQISETDKILKQYILKKKVVGARKRLQTQVADAFAMIFNYVVILRTVKTTSFQSQFALWTG